MSPFSFANFARSESTHMLLSHPPSHVLGLFHWVSFVMYYALLQLAAHVLVRGLRGGVGPGSCSRESVCAAGCFISFLSLTDGKSRCFCPALVLFTSDCLNVFISSCVAVGLSACWLSLVRQLLALGPFWVPSVSRLSCAGRLE